MIHANDVPRWRAKLDQIEAAVTAEGESEREWKDLDNLRVERNVEIREILRDLAQTKDLEKFRGGVDLWSRKPGPYKSFAGMGQMWMNQVSKHLPEASEQIVETIIFGLSTPDTIDGALQRIESVASVTRDLGTKSQRPAAGRVPYVLSLFWSTDEGDPRWPCMWNSAAQRMFDFGWVMSWENKDRYAAFHEMANTFYPNDVHRFDRLLWFVTERQKFVGLNPTLASMCSEAAHLMSAFQGGVGYPDVETADRASSLARQLRGELQIAMTGLLPALNEELGLALEKSQLQLKIAFDQNSAFRADAYATWSLPGGMASPGFRLWVTRSGLAAGLSAGWGGRPD